MRMGKNTILITGGGTGIGRGLAEAFHALGNQLIIAGRRRSALDAVTSANPGMASLQAALQPAATDYLYFVVRPDGSGGHQFSKELAEHARAVQQYRRGVREQERKAGGAAHHS